MKKTDSFNVLFFTLGMLLFSLPLFPIYKTSAYFTSEVTIKTGIHLELASVGLQFTEMSDTNGTLTNTGSIPGKIAYKVAVKSKLTGEILNDKQVQALELHLSFQSNEQELGTMDLSQQPNWMSLEKIISTIPKGENIKVTLHPSEELNYEEKYEIIMDFLLYPENVELKDYQQSFYGTAKGKFEIEHTPLSEYEVASSFITPAYYYYEQHNSDIEWIKPNNTERLIDFDYTEEQKKKMRDKPENIWTYPAGDPYVDNIIEEFASAWKLDLTNEQSENVEFKINEDNGKIFYKDPKLKEGTTSFRAFLFHLNKNDQVIGFTKIEEFPIVPIYLSTDEIGTTGILNLDKLAPNGEFKLEVHPANLVRKIQKVGDYDGLFEKYPQIIDNKITFKLKSEDASRKEGTAFTLKILLELQTGLEQFKTTEIAIQRKAIRGPYPKPSKIIPPSIEELEEELKKSVEPVVKSDAEEPVSPDEVTDFPKASSSEEPKDPALFTEPPEASSPVDWEEEESAEDTSSSPE